MKYFIIAGESSGDLYGGLLIRQLKKYDPEADFRYWGGPRMREAHAQGQLESIKNTAFMGFAEVAVNLIHIRKLFRNVHDQIGDFMPDIIILIDYPGFNLRLARWAKQRGFKTAYYISPQLWAWKAHRHRILKAYTDLFFVILPFEYDFYRNLDTPCIYVGHPLLELIGPVDQAQAVDNTIGLFPGSRLQEIRRHLPIMADVARRNPDYNFIVAGVSHIDRDVYIEYIGDYLKNLDLVMDNSHQVMSQCLVALTGSGTAALELALFDVPQVVIYKTSPLSFFIGKRLVKTRYISLVNLIAQKEVVPELLQDALTTDALHAALHKILDKSNQVQTRAAYKKIRAELTCDLPASMQVAEKITGYLNQAS